MNPVLQKLMEIAKETAKKVLPIYEQPFQVDYKAPEDPITEADRVANHFICEKLRSAFPDVPIVAEESLPEEWADYRSSERVFFVDPIDGTREFVAKTGHFAIMIGLLDGERPTHGLILAPVSAVIWGGAVGEGAFKIDADGVLRPLARLKGLPLAEAEVVSSKSRQNQLNKNALDLLKAKKITPRGSAGLKGAAVADSGVDIYLATGFAGCLWDSCAPEALIRAAGGVFTDARGENIDYRAAGVENNRGAVAAAPSLHTEVVERLSPLFR